MVYDDEKDAQLKKEIARQARYIEIAGFSVSLIALSLVLVIFWRYKVANRPAPDNIRSRIHRSLISTIVGQVIIRLILDIDQALIENTIGDQSNNENVTLSGISNTPYLCEFGYILLEYGITAMFMWKLIEGIYLHNIITASHHRIKMSHRLNRFLVWGISAIITATWATVNAIHYQQDLEKRCWYGYNVLPLYWIVQGPRMAVILINMVLLVNIIRVLILKHREPNNSEFKIAQKTARVALFLLPLLVITNGMSMVKAPYDRSVMIFALWSYSTHFLRSFQGFIFSVIHCFLNDEVKDILRKQYEEYMATRAIPSPRHRDSSPRHDAAAPSDLYSVHYDAENQEQDADNNTLNGANGASSGVPSYSGLSTTERLDGESRPHAGLLPHAGSQKSQMLPPNCLQSNFRNGLFTHQEANRAREDLAKELNSVGKATNKTPEM